MKIAIDARFFGPKGTGLGTYTQNLIEHLEKLDFKNHYFILLADEGFSLYQPHNSNFQKVKVNVAYYSLTEQLALPKILAKINPDLVHFCHFNIPLFYRGKFVVTIHDLIKHEFAHLASTTRTPIIYWAKHQAYKLVITQAISRSEKIFVPSNWVKKRIIDQFHVKSNKIITTYEAASQEFSRRQATSIPFALANQIRLADKQQEILKKYNIERPFLIYVGNLYPYKNLELVLKALKSLKNDYSTLKLLIASARDNFYQRFRQKIVDYQLQDKVITPGFVNKADLAILFAQAQAYVFPSLSEGFGIPGLDAMASELPILASDIAVFHEIYDNAVLYFDPKSEKDLAAKIKLILKNDDLRQGLITKGHKQVTKYSWQRMAKETFDVYKSIVK